MIEDLPESEVVDLPLLPSGWHIVSYSVLANGSLGIMGSKFDVRTYHARVDAAFRNGAGHAQPASPFENGGSISARIWVFDGNHLTDGPAFPLEMDCPKFDRLPEGRWVVSPSRSGADPKSCILNADGDEVRRIHLGDGINHVQCDDAGRIWVGWFDEGIYKNQGFLGDPEWIYPDRPSPPSSVGLAAFDQRGRVVAQAPCEVKIADCYALNVAGDTAWACTYTDFPIFTVAEGRPSQVWTTDFSGPSAIAVRSPHLLVAGGYGEAADRVILVRLGSTKAESLRQWRLPFNSHGPERPDLFVGRGETLHVVQKDRWYRWRIGNVLSS